MIILGIDPGLANTGWGVVSQRGSQYRCLAYGCITTDSKDELSYRLRQIYSEVEGVVNRYKPSEVSVESIFFGANTQSAFATGQARGVILLATADANLVLGEYSPLQIKKTIVGNGRAEKSQVQFMVKNTLKLDHEPKPDHAADALAAAICHGHLRKHKELERRTLEKVQAQLDAGEQM